MSSPQHGEFKPGWGYYNAGTGNWHSDASKIGPGHGGAPAREPDQSTREEYARQQSKARGAFTPNPELDQLIALRESPHQEKRETFERLAAGSRRMELHSYEQAKAAASTEG